MKIKNYKKVSTRIKRTVYEWQEIFDVWSEMMDVEYPEKDERNDMTEWVDSPADWMKPFKEEVFDAWMDNDGGGSPAGRILLEKISI